MRILACFDKFKDSLDADQVATAVLDELQAVAAEARRADVSTRILSLSDGGEGFLAALRRPYDLSVRTVQVVGPLGEPVMAQYGINPERGVAVIESSMANGLYLVPPEKRNPLHTTTHGVGQLIRAAYDAGARHIIVGVGGSATNDGALGALHALGLHVSVREGDRLVEPDIVFGRHLTAVECLASDQSSLLPGARIEIACDVRNPFIGPQGAVAVFSAQKGAGPAERDVLERGMVRLERLYRQHTGVALAELPGAGAAGGLAGGLCAVLGATLKPGVVLLGEAVGLEPAIAQSDLVLTGEGSYDAQTESGKVVSLVQALCAKHRVPCVVICGINKLAPQPHILSLVSMFDKHTSMTRTAECLRQLVRAHIDAFPGLVAAAGSVSAAAAATSRL